MAATVGAPETVATATDEAVPAAADVVVVGGGIVGASTAFFLSQRAISVVLCEKGRIAGEQSSRNWGWVRKMGRDPRELPLMMESERIWRGSNALVGADTGYRRSGIVYLCEGDADLARREAWFNAVTAFGLDSRFVGAAELRELLPGASRGWAGALYTESDGRAEPQRATPAIAAAARAQGACVVARCAVRGVERSAGKISGVVTEKGRIACSSVVVAGGAWSGLFCRSLGLRLPQLKVLASVMRVEGFDGGPEIAAASPQGFAFRKRQDGGYTVANGNVNVAEIVPDSFRYWRDFLPAWRAERRYIKLRVGKRSWAEARMPTRWALDRTTPFERVRVLDPKPSLSALAAARRRLETAFPAFRGRGVTRAWGGLIDATPDAVPVISGVDALPGLFVATGFSGHGFGIGPGAGRLMADLVTGATPVVDPMPFRFERFDDGSYGGPQAGL